jgi:hypothetical protein
MRTQKAGKTPDSAGYIANIGQIGPQRRGSRDFSLFFYLPAAWGCGKIVHV